MRKRSEAARPGQRDPLSSPVQQPSVDRASRPHNAFLNAYYERDRLVLVSRDEGGKVRLQRVRPEASCFVRRGDVDAELYRMLRESAIVRAVRQEGEWLRVVWCDRDTCRSASEALEKKGVATFEADVSPIRRYAADNRLEVARPRRCYLDLETDSRVPFSRKEDMRILVWCIVGEDGATTRLELEEDSDGAERWLLEQLWLQLEPFDQVASWNGDRFDFPVLRARTRKREIPIEPGRWLWIDHLELFRRMNQMAAESGDEKQSYALQAISMAILGEGKDDVDGSKSWEMWEAGGEQREKLSCYCWKDTDLMRRIEERTGYLELLQTLCEVCGTFPNSRGADPGSQVESFLLRLALERGEHFASRFDKGGGGKYRGAFVMEPTEKGILRGVHVADFASLYPSIILSWNMSPETLVKKPEPTRGGTPVMSTPSYLNHLPIVYPTRPVGVCEAAITGAWFDTAREGLLPAAVQHVLDLRRSWNEAKSKATPGTPEWKDADRRSTAYKIAANSFYGVVGSPLSKLFNREVAESVSQCGVWLIKETIGEAEKRGMRIVYGDTDSLFAMGCERAEFERFVAWCNSDLYPRLLEERGCATNRVKLAYEKAFERVVFCCAKKYAGVYSHYKGTAATSESKPEIKGLEYKRGDSVRLARELQETVVQLVVVDGCEEIVSVERVLERCRAHVLEGEIKREDAVVGKSLTQPISSYSRKRTKSGEWNKRPPHVEIAALLEERGRDVGEGTKISYYCSDGSGSSKTYKPAEDWADDVDRFDLWEALVWPPTKRLLEAAFPAVDWEPWGKVRPKKAAAPHKAVKSSLQPKPERSAPVERGPQLSLGLDLPKRRAAP